MKKILLSLALVLILGVPGAASAATVDELSAKLASLLAQVEQVRTELAAAQAAAKANAATTPGALCVQLTRTLALGSTDATSAGEVSMLQKVLAEDAALYPEGKVTGYFGVATQAAVKRLQVREGIVPPGSPAPGSVGFLTRTFFSSRCGGALPPSTSSTGTRPSLTNSLEAALATITLDTLPASTSTIATIAGSAKNLTFVSVSVRSSEVVFSNDAVPVKDGRWSVTTSPLASGSYQVVVKSPSGGAIATGFIIVDAPASAPASTPATPSTVEPAAPLPLSKVSLRVNGSDKGAVASPGSKILVGWSTENVSSCAFAANPSLELSGSVHTSEPGKSLGPVSKTTILTLTCTGADGKFISSSLTVQVTP